MEEGKFGFDFEAEGGGGGQGRDGAKGAPRALFVVGCGEDLRRTHDFSNQEEASLVWLH